MKKGCNFFIENYLSLDKGADIPLWLTWHLLTCKNCRGNVRLLKRTEAAAAKPLNEDAPINDADIAAVLDKIYSAEKSRRNPISLVMWIAGGALMVAVFIVYALFTKGARGDVHTVYTYVEFTALITIYCAIFVRGNMDYFVKLINTQVPKKRDDEED